MEESNEPPVTPVVNEAQCDPGITAASENQDSASQNPVPANFVEIFQISKPASPDKEEPPEEETEEETEEEAEDDPDEETISPRDQQIAAVTTRYQQEQETRKKGPLPSDLKSAEMRRAATGGDWGKASEFVLVQPEMEKRRSPLVSIPPFGRGFSRDGGLSIPMELGGARTSPRAPFIVSMSPPDYPSAWLRPRSARFRFARQVHCSSATTCRFSTCSWPVIPPDVIALDYNSYLP
jgi:hypothetical protein